MTDKYVPSSANTAFGTYASTQAASAAAQTEIVDGIQSLAALFGITISDAGAITGYTGTADHPDFNKISDATRVALARELSALATAVEARATA